MLTRPDFHLINDLANICAPGTDNNILTSFLIMAFLLSLVCMCLCITQGGTKPSSEQDWEMTLRFNSVNLCFCTAVLEVGSAYSSATTSLPRNQAVIEMNGQQPLGLYTVHISISIPSKCRWKRGSPISHRGKQKPFLIGVSMVLNGEVEK